MTPGRIVRAAQRAPATVGAVAVLWLLGAATGALVGGPPPRVLDAVGAGVGPLAHGRVDTLLMSAAWCSGLAGYLAATACLVAFVGPAEARLGTAWAAGLFGLTQVGGLGAALGLVALGFVATGRGTGDGWAVDLAGGLVVGPFAGAVGTGLALSSRFAALWRRRVRLAVLVGLVLLVLYSGELSDVVRLAAAVVGLVAGRFLLGGAPRAGPPSRSEARLLVAVLVAATALGPVVAAFSAAPIGPLSVLQYVVLPPPPGAATVQQVCATPAVADDCAALRARLRLSGVGPALLSLVPVLLLLVLADGLRRGRRAAWRGAVVANLALAGLGAGLAASVRRTPAERLVVFGGLPGSQFALATALPLVTPLAVAVVLVAVRRRFTVRAPAGTSRRLTVAVATALVAVSALYLVGGTLDAGGFDRPPSPSRLLASLPFRFVPPGYLAEVTPRFLPVTVPATLLFEWTGVVFWLVVCAALLRMFLTARAHAADADTLHARALVERDGGTLSWLATWPGNAYWFVPDGATGFAYRVIGGVAVTTGDPFGDPGARAAAVAVAGFAAFCRDNGWTPCFYSVTDAVRAAAPAGFRSVQVAEETVLALPGLAFTGRHFQDVRTALNKATKAGVTAEWLAFRHAPLALTDQIRAISEEWVADKGLPEMGFTLGGLEELADDAVRCLVAVDADRTVHGVTSWLPVHRDGAVIGWTLDFMRRRDTGFRGVMEFLIASAALRCRDEGAELLSLSGAPLARHDHGGPTGPLQQLLDRVGRALEPVYGFASLLAFKAKFAPAYRPLYLLYDDPVALPAIAGAIGRAYLPQLDARQGTRLARRLLRDAPAAPTVGRTGTQP